MIVSKLFYNITCDNCGCLLDTEMWYEDCDCSLDDLADCSEWKKIEGKHYCPDCYSYDDEGNLITDKNSDEQ